MQPPEIDQSPPRAERAVTVLMVTHNSEADLTRCLDALALAAPRSPLAIKVWDNASGDHTLRLLGQADIPVVVSAQNIGFGRAVNRLADNLHSPFIFLLNPDAAPQPGGLDVLIDAALARPDRDMFCGRTIFEDGRENQNAALGRITPFSAFMLASGLSLVFPKSPFFAPETFPRWDRLSDREVDVAAGCALLIRREVWQDLHGFDPRYWLYGEEAELQHRMVQNGRKKPWFVSDAVTIHDNGPQFSGDEPLETRIFRVTCVMRGRATFMRQCWPKHQQLLVSPILFLQAVRYGLSAVLGRGDRPRHRRLWQTRKEWMAGYPACKESA